MRERLIELLKGAETEVSELLSRPLALDEWLGIYADHLLANGVIVPPCKVGDKVYRIVKLFCDKTIIVEGEVFEFAITHESAKKDEYRFYFRAFNEDFVHRQYSKWCDFFDFGKTVFTSRAEAEREIERRNEK